MQKVSAKKMSHEEARQYRDEVEDAVMYQHTNGKVYLLNLAEDNRYWERPDRPRLYSTNTNELLIG